MKLVYIIGLIVSASVFLSLVSCTFKSGPPRRKEKNNAYAPKSKAHNTNENVFNDLRKMALTVTPVQLGLSFPPHKTVVYGVVMDWEMGGNIATTVSYQTGDASLYLSSGGAVIGGGQRQNVNNAAERFVSVAQEFLDKATKTKETPLPATDEVRFYLLTNHGVFVGGDIMRNFENNTSSWLGLFEEGNKVIAELRTIGDE